MSMEFNVKIAAHESKSETNSRVFTYIYIYYAALPSIEKYCTLDVWLVASGNENLFLSPLSPPKSRLLLRLFLYHRFIYSIHRNTQSWWSFFVARCWWLAVDGEATATTTTTTKQRHTLNFLLWNQQEPIQICLALLSSPFHWQIEIQIKL